VRSSAWLRLICGLAVVCAALAVPRAASAIQVEGSAIRADLDRDGVPDTINVDPHQRTLLHIRLSSQPQINDVHLVRPVIRLAVADVDGDGSFDIITSHSPTKKNKWFTVWQYAGGNLKKVKPKAPRPRTMSPPRGSVQGADNRNTMALPGQSHDAPSCDADTHTPPRLTPAAAPRTRARIFVSDQQTPNRPTRAPPASTRS
jgi:hypothetical protein